MIREPVFVAHLGSDGARRGGDSISGTGKQISRPRQQSSFRSRRANLWHVVSRDLYSLWLFTLSDLKTIVVPQSIFGILNAAHAESFGLPARLTDGSRVAAAVRICLTFFWVWMTLLPFNINNQRQPEAIAEDALNKPWRPLPARRLTSKHAWRLMLLFYPASLVLSCLVGSTRQCLALVALGTWYNCLGGADSGPSVRNLINALGFLCFSTGAMEVSYGRSLPFSLASTTVAAVEAATAKVDGNGAVTHTGSFLAWVAIIAAVIFSTVQSQDLADQQGDALRGRRTLPLVIGDVKCRVTLCLLVPFWSLVVPIYWRCHVLVAALVVLQGAIIALRTWTKRDVDSDKNTFRVWNVWLVSLYVVPLAA